jgi:UDP-N-acetylmuramyl pentapeptide phosphotransferase/UDP-N-acetylglucosamine-1-phosphate transferase
MNLWAPIAAAFLSTLVSAPLVVRLLRRWGFWDRPSPRSSHRVAVLRGAGVAVLLGAAVGAFSAFLMTETRSVSHQHRMLFCGVALLAAAGVWDDRFGLSVPLKLLAQIVAAATLVSACGGLTRFPLPRPLDWELGSMGPVVTLLWILLVTNAYNFMDGIDGLASLQGVVTGFGLGVAVGGGLESALALALAGACAGFLPWNWAPASAFLGDVGSSVLGYTFAAIPLLAPMGSREDGVLFVILSLWLFLADAIWTRMKRIGRGGEWYAAHREHIYQRLVDTGVSHARVTLAIGSGSALITAAALAVRLEMPVPSWLVIAFAMGISACELSWVRRREIVQR